VSDPWPYGEKTDYPNPIEGYTPPTLPQIEPPVIRRASDLDPVPIGQLQSTTVWAAITGIVSILALFGVKWTVNDQQIQKASEGVISLISLGAFVWAWVGRVRATKQVSSSRMVTEAKKNLPVVLICLLFCTGCLGNLNTSPLVQIYSAKQAYATSLDEFKSAVDSHMITNPTVLKTAYVLIPEITKTLNDATVKAKAGDKIGYQFLWEQLQSKLTRFLQLQAPANRVPQSLLMERDLPCPQRSLHPSLLKPSLAYSSLSRRSRPSSPAELLRRNSRLSSISTFNSLQTARCRAC
jgi:4-amino-4-deoxy-L-arabinose transferase-like glycosyltransferase